MLACTQARIRSRVAAPATEETMRKELTFSELESEHVELLPARETLFFNHYNWASIAATNSSMALNAATMLSQANSAAVQTITVGQG